MYSRTKHFALVAALLLMTQLTAAEDIQPIILRASDAKLSGPSVRMNNDTQVAAWWKNPLDSASWQLTLERPQRLDVLLVYGVPDLLADQPLVIEIDGKRRLQSKLPGTGGYAVFRQHFVGTLDLAAGKHQLAFRPAGQVQGDDLVDLKAVILAPHDPNRPRSTAPMPLEPVADMLQHLRVPEGFVVQQVAGPPLVERPISIDFDQYGRLYVTEASGTNDRVQQQIQDLPHRIVRLEDTDGNGTFDKKTVFADRMMLPEGALWHNGSLYVTSPPHIWKLTDVDGDGVADRREVWYHGTLSGCANDLHGPFLGPDGWIYWCKGEFAELRVPRGNKPPLVTRAAHIFRRHPDGGPVEIVMTGGMNNPVDVAFTRGGERIFSTTFLQIPAGGRRDGLLHAVYGGVYPRKNFVVNGHPRTGKLMPVLTHMGVAAPCGLIRLESKEHGFQDNLLACQFNTHKVSRHVLAPRGATFITQDEDLLTSDHKDFHPTDVLEDADGSILVVNTGGWYMLCCPTSRMHKPDVLGAIYRIRRVGAHDVADPRGGSINWASLPSNQLRELLGDVRPFVRRRALQQLVAIGQNAVPDLTMVLENHSSGEARLQAVQALTRIDHPSARAAVRIAIADSDQYVRQMAIHSAGLWRDRAASESLIRTLASESLHNRRAAAEAIGRIGDPGAVGDLLNTTSDYRGRVLDHSLVYAMIDIGDAEQIKKALSMAHPRTRRAAMLVLENIARDSLQADSIIKLLDSDDPHTADAAWWILQRHPEWADSLAESFRNRVREPSPTPQSLASLKRDLTTFSEAAAIQRIMADGLQSQRVSPLIKRAILGAIKESRVQIVPKQWWAALGALLKSKDDQTVIDTVAAIHAHSQSPLTEQLRGIATSRALPVETRLRALACGAGDVSLDDDLFKMLTAELAATRPVRNRSLAIDIIAKTNLREDQLIQLAHRLRATASMDLARLVMTFENSRSTRVGTNLIEALNQTPAADTLQIDAVRKVLAQYDQSVGELAGPLLTRIQTASQAKAGRFAAVMKLMRHADVRRGQDVFFGTKAACSACHAIAYRGGRVGPDLTRIGRIRDDRSLLESVLYPSASFVQSYEPTTIVTIDGTIHHGVVKDENDVELVLSLNAEKEIRIRTDDIEQRTAGKVSIMPAGLEKQLTPQQLADLIVYLKSVQ